MKHELLIPVGNKESLIAAINNGADAVYLAGKKYGARAYAENFSLEEIEQATITCHKYGVKIFITVNTLIYEQEIQEALEYIEQLHQIGVDAIIMQDIGLIKLTHETFPNLEIHASTQMHNHSQDNIQLLEELGIKRIVFARELSLEQINNIKTKMQKEVFIHGSLCISYSGQCYYSKFILNRSANRGECAGMCRLKYQILKNNETEPTIGDYLLSPKDLCTIDKFKELMKSNIYSFKIEGRMKSPAYVAIVTKIYRKLIDDYENNIEPTVPEEYIKQLKSIFYREYTTGNLFNDKNIINQKSSNHIGLYAGKITNITPKKIEIKLAEDLHQFDSIRFKQHNKGITLNYIYDKKDNLINKAYKNDTIYIDNFLNLTTKDEIYITSPKYIPEKIITKKINIKMNFTSHLNENIILEIEDDNNKIKVIGPKPEPAITTSITKEQITKSLTKTGNTPYQVTEINIELDNNLFIRNIDLNNLRREAIIKLTNKRIEKPKYIKQTYTKQNQNPPKTKEILVLARTKEQIEILKQYPVKIIVDKPQYLEKDFIYKIPRNNYTYQTYQGKVMNTSYASMIKNKNQISDYFLNITNHYSLDIAQKYNQIVTLSPENTYNDIKQIMQNTNSNTAILIYGRIELMIMKNCIINNINKQQQCTLCQENNTYQLKDRNNKQYPIITDYPNHTSYILNHHITNKIQEIKEYQNIGINNFRVDLYNETPAQTKHIIEQIISNIN